MKTKVKKEKKKTRLEELQEQHQKIVGQIGALQEARLRTEGAILMMRELQSNGPKDLREEHKK